MPTTRYLLPGDVVEVTKWGVVRHPMIHVGDGWFIEKAVTSEVRARHASSFAAPQHFRVNYRPHPVRAQQIVARAAARLGPERYDVLTANCEHFVSEVVTGRARSPQAEAVGAADALGLAALVVTALAETGARSARPRARW